VVPAGPRFGVTKRLGTDTEANGLLGLNIISETQNLGPEELEEVRLNSKLKTQTDNLLQILLTEQPEPRRKAARTELRQQRQRIALQHHVQPVPEEIYSYLRHRFSAVGGTYAPGVEPVVYAFTGGYPLSISLLADPCLVSGYARKLKPLTADPIEGKGGELESLEPPLGLAANTA
jgi:general secretion pathway protein A